MKTTKVLGKDIKKLTSLLDIALSEETEVLFTLEVGESPVQIDKSWDGQHSIWTNMGRFPQDEIDSVTLIEKDDGLPQLIIKLLEFEVLHTTYE